MNEKNKHVSIREFELAWQEFFKGKFNPKNNEEEKEQLKEFHYWYNNIRKQSDTGKTPNEMYKEIYGKEPPNDQQEQPSRMINFGWNEDEEDSLDLNEMRNSFDKEIWPRIKNELKEMSKKDACFFCFSSGFEIAHKSIEENIKDFEDELKEMPAGKIKKLIKKDKK